MENSKKPKVAVIGGGASGFFCAIQLKEQSYNQLDVCIIEKTSKLLSKVRISGGGRCNVTNACPDNNKFATHYPRGEKFLKKAFHVFNNQDIIDWFQHHKVNLVAEADGRMFPETHTSETIVDTFIDLTSKFKIPIYTQANVRRIHKNAEGGYTLNINGEELVVDYIVIAIGGYPKKEMYEWLNNVITAEEVVQPVPSLFSFNLPNHPLLQLQGLALSNVQVKLLGTKLQTLGPVLCTHWGISGPGVLKLSAWGARILEEKNYHFDILLNWLSEYKEDEIAAQLLGYQTELATRKIANKNPFQLPNRFWELMLELSDISLELTWAHLKAKQRNILAKNLCNMQVAVKGKTTFKEEFVTAGGVDTAFIDHHTMALKAYPEIYVVGEALNIDGITGGFNFQNAWTTAFIAAQSIVKQHNK